MRNSVESLLTVGATGMQICPIAAMVGYLMQRGDKPGLLFTFEDGRALTRDSFVTVIRAALRAYSIDHTLYAGHSFQVGLVTQPQPEHYKTP